jgi:hypothetical protein
MVANSHFYNAFGLMQLDNIAAPLINLKLNKHQQNI